MWPWYFMSIGTRSRIQITQGLITHVVEVLAVQRERHKYLQTPNQLGWIIDVTDVFLRFVLNADVATLAIDKKHLHLA